MAVDIKVQKLPGGHVQIYFQPNTKAELEAVCSALGQRPDQGTREIPMTDSSGKEIGGAAFVGGHETAMWILLDPYPGP